MTTSVTEGLMPIEQFTEIQTTLSGHLFPWFFNGYVAYEKDNSDFYFTHTMYENHTENSNWFNLTRPLLEIIKPKALIRIRALQYIGRDKLVEHAKHADFDYSHHTCVFYLNTNDGFTRLHDGTCVQSVENRAVFFDGSLQHNSTNCTSARRRLVLTVNYF